MCDVSLCVYDDEKQAITIKLTHLNYLHVNSPHLNYLYVNLTHLNYLYENYFETASVQYCPPHPPYRDEQNKLDPNILHATSPRWEPECYFEPASVQYCPPHPPYCDVVLLLMVNAPMCVMF